MKYNELRWSHLAQVSQQLARYVTTARATKDVGFTTNVWARVRKSWDELPAHLAVVDPHGTPVDLARLDAQIRQNMAQGGRPRGSKSATSGDRPGAQVTQPTLRVSDASFYVEDGVFFVEDE